MSFRRSDYQCPCDNCTSRPTVDYELVMVVEDLETAFGQPVRIHSGYRCRDRNAFVGGSSGSLHIKGKAADISIEGINPSMVASYLEDKFPNTFGIGRYRGHTHIDVRTSPARWDTTG